MLSLFDSGGIQISGRFDLKSSGARTAENCHIWKADGKAIATVAIIKMEKQL